MLKKISTLAGLLAILAAIGFVYSQNQPARASQTVFEVQRTSTVQTEKPTQIPTTENPQDILKKLTDKASGSTRQAGWLYTLERTRYDIDLDSNGVLPNGKSIPASYTIESWTHVNVGGLAFEGVSILRDENGEISQVSVFSDNKSWNSMTDEISDTEPLLIGSLDFGFSKQLAEFEQKTGKKADVAMDTAQNLVIFKFVDSYDKPITITDYKQPVAGNINIASFDSATGFLTNHEEISIFVDGSQRVFTHTDFSVTLGIEPPAEILKYFEERK